MEKVVVRSFGASVAMIELVAQMRSMVKIRTRVSSQRPDVCHKLRYCFLWPHIAPDLFALCRPKMWTEEAIAPKSWWLVELVLALVLVLVLKLPAVWIRCYC